MNDFKIGDKVYFWFEGELQSAFISGNDVTDYPNFYELFQSKKQAIEQAIKENKQELIELEELLKDCYE